MKNKSWNRSINTYILNFTLLKTDDTEWTQELNIYGFPLRV